MIKDRDAASNVQIPCSATRHFDCSAQRFSQLATRRCKSLFTSLSECVLFFDLPRKIQLDTIKFLLWGWLLVLLNVIISLGSRMWITNPESKRMGIVNQHLDRHSNGSLRRQSLKSPLGPLPSPPILNFPLASTGQVYGLLGQLSCLTH